MNNNQVQFDSTSLDGWVLPLSLIEFYGMGFRTPEGGVIDILNRVISSIDNTANAKKRIVDEYFPEIFQCAIRNGQFSVADFILSQGLNVDVKVDNPIKNRPRVTLLELNSICPNNTEQIKYLLDNGADPKSESGVLEYLFQCFMYDEIPESAGKILHLLLGRRNYSVNAPILYMTVWLGRELREGEPKYTVSDLLADSIGDFAVNKQACMDVLVFFMFHLTYRVDIERMPKDIRGVLGSIYRANESMPDELLRHVSTFLL